MRFGSVAFFKVLIKTVLFIAFFVPLILCVIFAVVLWNKNSELEKTKFENEKLAYTAELLGGKTGNTVGDFYDIYSHSGLTDEELVEYILSCNQSLGEKYKENDNENPQGESSKPIADDSGQSGGTESGGESEPEGGSSQTEEASSASEPTPPAEPSPYEDIHPDLMVSAPAQGDYVREQGVIYLTFDDGPSANTYSILYWLAHFNVKATFFVVPKRTDECFEMLRAIVNDGHSIGVHSATHEYEKIYASTEAFLEDYYEAWSIIYEATGVKTEIFRFPGGSNNDYSVSTRADIIKEMTRRGFRYYDWNVQSNDISGATYSDMYNRILVDAGNNYRSFVLFHDSPTAYTTVLLLEELISVLRQEGYKFDKINNNTLPIQFVDG